MKRLFKFLSYNPQYVYLSVMYSVVFVGFFFSVRSCEAERRYKRQFDYEVTMYFKSGDSLVTISDEKPRLYRRGAVYDGDLCIATGVKYFKAKRVKV